ncbi:MAG: hypothetical protein IT566_12465 [Rhodospirillaceae bacterium]|nr:hypothetical protein [Rhodospirillaceae bacterium]
MVIIIVIIIIIGAGGLFFGFHSSPASEEVCVTGSLETGDRDVENFVQLAEGRGFAHAPV